MGFYENMINDKIINIHTAFIGKVISADGSRAVVKPLNYSKNSDGSFTEKSTVTAYIPKNIKTEIRKTTIYEERGIEYLYPADLIPGDIVYCGICERDITPEMLDGNITKPTRHHSINDSVILAVF